MGYYEQLALYEQYEKDLRQYNIEKPLWVFVGSRVISSSSSTLTQGDKESISDVSRIVKFFKYALSSPTALQSDINKILKGDTGLRDADGNDIFKGRFEYLKKETPIAESILTKVFNGIGNIEAYQVKQADGEIALKTKTADQYFSLPFAFLTVDAENKVFVLNQEEETIRNAPGFDKDHWPETNSHYYSNSTSYWGGFMGVNVGYSP